MPKHQGISRAVEDGIMRFGRPYQRRLRKMVVVSPRLCDLLVSFPAAAFALVSGFGDADRRGRAVKLVKGGSSLKDIALELGLPFWTRKLPPESFRGPLGELPDDEAFARSVGNVVPCNGEQCAVWLAWVGAGYQGCDSRFALWLASQKAFARAEIEDRAPVAPLAAYAWFSSRPSRELGRALIRRPWQSSMGFSKAVDEAGTWVNRVADELRPAPCLRGPGRYSRRNALKGYYVVVLRTGSQLRDEGRVMDHCVGDYDRKVAAGECVIVSIRFGSKRLATMELVRGRGVASAPYGIAQLQGPENSNPSSAVSKVARDWVGKYGRNPLVKNAVVDEAVVDEKAWAQMWAPYLARERVGDDRGFNLSGLLSDVEQLGQCR